MPHEAPQKHICVIVGADDYLVDAAARKFRAAALGPDAAPTATETVYGDASNEPDRLASISRCLDSWQTPAFFDPVKLTWWRNVTFLPGAGAGGDGAHGASPLAATEGGSGRKLSDAVKIALEKFARAVASATPPPNQYLLVTAPRLLATSVFAKTLAPVADMQVFAAGGTLEQEKQLALSRLEALAAAEGVSFKDPGAEAAFVEKVGPDTRTLASEVAKLRTWLGRDNHPVDEDDFAQITSATAQESEIWNLSEAIARRDPRKTVAIWRGYQDDSGGGIKVSVYLEKIFREWIVYADALERGWVSPEGRMAQGLPPKVMEDLAAAGIAPKPGRRNSSPFDWRKLAQVSMFRRRDPRGYIARLRKGRFLMLRLRERLTSARLEPEQVELELIRTATL